MRGLITDSAAGRTFELFSATGSAPADTDWPGLFSALTPDSPGALDGARDRSGPDLAREPSPVPDDVTRLRAGARRP